MRRGSWVLWVVLGFGGLGCEPGVIQGAGEDEIKDVAQQQEEIALGPDKTYARCQGLDWYGRCAGDVAEWCYRGRIRRRDCARYGQVCGLTDHLGYYCTAPVTPPVTPPPDPCVGQTCSGHGSCTQQNNAAVCLCAAGFHAVGLTCVQDAPPPNPCQGQTCSGHGSCTVQNNAAVCLCAAGFHAVGLTCVQDTPPPSTAKTFTVTAVQDGLDNADMSIMASGLISLGYTQSVKDTNVTTSELTQYLAGTLTLLYHTGHGNNGIVATANGALQIHAGMLNAENSIFATCLTLSDTNWKTAFGARAQSLMGYTNLSYDGIDDDVVRTYLAELQKGTSHPKAWYQANVGVSQLRDRWATYVREAAGVVEYSARRGNVPKAGAGVSFTRILPDLPLYVDPGLLGSAVDAGAIASVQVVGTPKRLAFVDGADLPEWRGASYALTEEQALSLSASYLSSRGGIPADAFVSQLVPVSERRDPQDPYLTVGFLVVYSRRVDGLSVRGNRIEDHLMHLVSGSAVVAESLYWPDLQVVKAGQWAGKLLSPLQALQAAGASLSRFVKQHEMHITEINLVQGTLGVASPGALVPAYELKSSEGLTAIIDAISGKVLL